MHLDLDQTIALAGLAAPAFDVERKATGLVAAGFGFRQACKPVADRAEGAGIGCRVGPGGSPDGRLVDDDDLIDLVHAQDGVVGAGGVAGAVQVAGQRLVQRLQRQRRLARAGYPGDTGHDPHRELDRQVVKIVRPRALNPQRPSGLARSALRRHRDGAGAAEVLTSDRCLGFLDLGRGALSHHLTAVDTGTRTHVDQIVSRPDRVLVVLDYQHGVAQVPEPGQGLQQAVVVALMQADRWFVEHVQHPGQPRADLGGQTDALALSPR